MRRIKLGKLGAGDCFCKKGGGFHFGYKILKGEMEIWIRQLETWAGSSGKRWLGVVTYN